MPEIQRYVVKQTREVKVQANSAADAVRLAEAAFEYGQNSDSCVLRRPPERIWGNTLSKIQTIEVSAHRQ